MESYSEFCLRLLSFIREYTSNTGRAWLNSLLPDLKPGKHHKDLEDTVARG